MPHIQLCPLMRVSRQRPCNALRLRGGGRIYFLGLFLGERRSSHWRMSVERNLRFHHPRRAALEMGGRGCPRPRGRFASWYGPLAPIDRAGHTLRYGPHHLHLVVRLVPVGGPIVLVSAVRGYGWFDPECRKPLCFFSNFLA